MDEYGFWIFAGGILVFAIVAGIVRKILEKRRTEAWKEKAGELGIQFLGDRSEDHLAVAQYWTSELLCSGM